MMHRIPGLTHSLLRIVAGLLFFDAGAMKMLGWFGGMPAGVPMTPLITAAGVIELVGGALILLGLFTRPVAFLASGEMAFAYFMGHFPHGFWPIQNHGEPAVLLVAPKIRPWVARLMRYSTPSLSVLAYNEIPENRRIRVIAAVGR
jgi:putative oxidoreductase